MGANKALEERVGALEKSMGTIVNALREINKEMKQVEQKQTEQNSEEIQEILNNKMIISDKIEKNADAIERLNREIVRREKEVFKDDFVQMNMNDKVVENAKDYKLTKCRYFDQGFCKYRKKCRYSHPLKTCEEYSVKGQCDVENCPHRHPQMCRSWESTNYCERNINCDFLHVTMANGDDGYQISTPKFKCASCKNVWEERSCIVTHIIQGHETFFCLNCEDWVKFKTNVFDQNWTLYDEAGNLKRDI